MATMPAVLRRTRGSAALGLAFVHGATSLPAGILLSMPVLVVLVPAIALVPVGGLGFLLTYLLLQLASRAARVERARADILLGVRCPVPAYPGNRVLQTLRDGRRWREIGYLALLLPGGALTFALTAGAAGAGLALVTAPLYVGSLPSRALDLGAVRVDSGAELAGSVLLGAALLILAPILARGATALHGLLVVALLGADDRAQLVTRVEQLTSTRARVVDASDAERRRIERDLHDGAQQRLVLLAMELGMAKGRLTGDPEALATVTSAHSEVKAVIAELRDLVRGIHPAVLEDRGLDAALSALAARCPVPVRIECELPRRCPRQIEAIAYFVTAECLTNVARHAEATSVTVSARHTEAALMLTIADDGRGGADPGAGSGLAGLGDRVAAVDGQLVVLSPLGGPTSIHVELPCAS